MNRPEYIDIHSHVNFGDYDTDREDVMKRAKDANVWMINVGTGIETSKQGVALADGEAEKGNDGVFAIVGLHPIYTSQFVLKDGTVKSEGEVFDKEAYRELLRNPKVVGIGECGLDFFHLPDHVPLKADAIEKQKDAFRAQIEVAIEFNKPIMIHARESYREILEILDEYLSTSEGRLRGNAHFFAGTAGEAKAFLDRGFTLSFTGVITFARQYKELIELTPLDRIMSETDCPYVTPVPFRGTRNEPLYVREVSHKIAEIKGVDVEIVKKALVDNAFRVFGLSDAK